jgi:hypothetical protein
LDGAQIGQLANGLVRVLACQRRHAVTPDLKTPQTELPGDPGGECMVGDMVVNQDRVPALGDGLATPLRKEWRREDGWMLRDEVPVRTYEVRPESFDIEQVQFPAECVRNKLVSVIVFRRSQRLSANKDDLLRVVQHLLDAFAVAD